MKGGLTCSTRLRVLEEAEDVAQVLAGQDRLREARCWWSRRQQRSPDPRCRVNQPLLRTLGPSRYFRLRGRLAHTNR